MTSDEEHGRDLGSGLAARPASVLRDWRQVIRLTFPSHGRHRLAGKGRRKCSQIGRVRSGQYLVAWCRGCSCCSCGGGFCLGWDPGTLSAETGCPSTVYAWPSLGKALFSESVVAPSKEYKVIPNVTPYVTNSEGGLKLYSDVPRGGWAHPFLSIPWGQPSVGLRGGSVALSPPVTVTTQLCFLRCHRILWNDVTANGTVHVADVCHERTFGENSPSLRMSYSLRGLVGGFCAVLKIIRSFNR